MCLDESRCLGEEKLSHFDYFGGCILTNMSDRLSINLRHFSKNINIKDSLELLDCGLKYKVTKVSTKLISCLETQQGHFEIFIIHCKIINSLDKFISIF